MIYSNKAQCLACFDIIESLSCHHFQKCSCGQTAVDGGKDYLRRVFGHASYKEMSEHDGEDAYGRKI